jgi:ABC-type amino acid transport substrate-binding protein
MSTAKNQSRRAATRVSAVLAALVAGAALLAGCGAFPQDPDRTFERVQGGELRVGITHSPPWTDTSAEQAPSGREVALAEEFAESLDADIVWTVGSEATIAEGLRNGDLDLGIGGFTDDTPWIEKAAITRPFAEDRVDGQAKKHVMLTALGENRFLTSLETFLTEHGSEG